MKIRKPWVSWEEFEAIVGGTWTPAAHTHVKIDITDTPWAWADVLKAGSNLTDLATRQHAGLSDAPADAHHAQLHAASHHVAGADLLAFADITGFGTYLDQAVKQASSPTFATVKLSALTDGYIPYHVADATGLANSPIRIDGANVGIGCIPTDKLDIAGAIRVTTNIVWNAGLPGRIYKSAAGGLALVGVTGTSYDFAISTPAGQNLFTNPTGTNNTVLNPDAGNVGIGKDPTCALDVNGTIKATLFQGNLHWDYITNEPTYYPPEYHYHVGTDLISLHLVDLDDAEAGDIFDVLPTAAIDGEGNYDWWGTWDTTAAANTSATVEVLAGVDKYLRLTDANNGGIVETELVADTGHPMVTGVIQFRARISSKETAYLDLMKGATRSMGFEIYDGGVGDRKFWFWNGTADVEILAAYNVDTWYTIRIHFDCVARAAVIFVDNVFVARTALSAATICDYVDSIRVRTDVLSTGYTFDINNLKVFNLTI